MLVKASPVQLAEAIEQNMYTLPCMLSRLAPAAATDGGYPLIAVYAVLLWEALINLDEEHELIHYTRWGHVKVCYLACRYYPIIVMPLYLWACLSDVDQRICSKVILPLQIFLVPLTLFPQFVILIRAYGFTGRNIYVLLLLCACFATFVFLQFWGFAKQTSTVAHKFFAVLGTCRCSTAESEDFGHTRHVGYVMVASIATDAVALIVVLIHCVRIRTTQGPLGRLFLQQGIIGFLIVLVLNIVSVFAFLGPDRSQMFGVVYPLMIPNIIACRFILQLRRRVSPTETFQLRRQSQLVRDAVGLTHVLHPPDSGQTPPGVSQQDCFLTPIPKAHSLLPHHNMYFQS